jgi:hypothetical protein
MGGARMKNSIFKYSKVDGKYKYTGFYEEIFGLACLSMEE